jgi:hypothetical protein
VNYECTNLDLSQVTLPRRLDVDSDRLYSSEEMDRLFIDTADILIYIGCIIIRRDVWLARDRARYYDSLLMHFAVLFQEKLPGDALLIAKPLVTHRDGNTRSFWSEVFEVLLFKWPALVWSLAPSEAAKRSISPREPWRNAWSLLNHRALSLYSLTEYRQWIHPRLRSVREMLAPFLIAVTPGVVVNTLLVLYYSVTRTRLRKVNLLFLRASPFYLRNYRPFGRKAQVV